jgi:RNA polymerase sigma-70 factor (ECF subfamily)
VRPGSGVEVIENPRAVTGLEEHFFRREYALVVASLVRRIGAHELAAIEDAVQPRSSQRSRRWTRTGPPENPSAGSTGWEQSGPRRAAGARVAIGSSATPRIRRRRQTDVLHLLVLCCDDALPPESQLVLALRTSCGFDVPEIAERLFLTEANVYKLSRTRSLSPARGAGKRRALRATPAVLSILYVLFAEGHRRPTRTLPFRRELCEEAMRLATLLADNIRRPESPRRLRCSR